MGGYAMRVLISGARGFIGRALGARLEEDGHAVVALTRGEARPGTIHWDPTAGELDLGALEGFDAVIHLAGESAAGGRWTAARKAAIRSSRVAGTALLAGALSRLKRPPAAMVCASGINAYGNTGDTAADEASPFGAGFLASVCQEWEAAAAAAADAGIRVVTLRIGTVLAPGGGALGRLLPLYRLGLGGPVGSGRQWMSWVTRDEVVAIAAFALGHQGLAGVVNAVSPSPVRNREFAATLGRVVRRPALLPAPAFALRLLLGEMADDLLLASLRVRPTALERAGYPFVDRELEPALRRILVRPSPTP